MEIESWHDFNWGRPIKDHRVGQYTIREFHPHAMKGSHVLKEIDESVTLYHGYIGSSNEHESWDTLDGALAGLIVRRSLGSNHRAINQHFIAGINALASTRG